MPGHAAVHGERAAGDVTRRWTGQEDNRGAQLVLLADPGHRARPHDCRQHVFGDLSRHLSGEVAGRHGVDPDSPPPGPLLGQIAGEADEACLAGGVGGLGATVLMSRTLETLTMLEPGCITLPQAWAIQ